MRNYLRRRLAGWIRRRQGPDAFPLTLSRRRLYVLPTRIGVGFGLVLVLMLIAGLNYANSTALFLTFLLAGFSLVAMHQCHGNMLGAQLLAANAEATFARQDGALTLTFENSGTMARYRIAAGVGDERTIATDLPPGGRESLELRVSAPRRGRVRVDRLHLISTYPFGLFRTWTWVHAPIEMLVYPQPRGSLPMPTSTGRKVGAQSVVNTGCDEWLGLRPFRDGDSPRQVDWKAYARESPLLVKEYAASGSDLRQFEFGALQHLEAEARLEQLARWVVDAEAIGVSYGLTLPGICLDPDRGPEHRHRCLAALALFGLESEHHGPAER